MSHKFKAKTICGSKIPCPYCLNEEDIWDNPSSWLPSDDEDYEDVKKTCSKCKKNYFVSCEVQKDWIFVSRYKPLDEFETHEDID